MTYDASATGITGREHPENPDQKQKRTCMGQMPSVIGMGAQSEGCEADGNK
jgi:hypothetical protein